MSENETVAEIDFKPCLLLVKGLEKVVIPIKSGVVGGPLDVVHVLVSSTFDGFEWHLGSWCKCHGLPVPGVPRLGLSLVHLPVWSFCSGGEIVLVLSLVLVLVEVFHGF